jgi:DNA-binding CsgD family transcriptional regulator
MSARVRLLACTPVHRDEVDGAGVRPTRPPNRAARKRARESLRQAVIAVDQAGNPSERRAPHDAFTVARGEARFFFLIDAFESAGARYLVLREITPDGSDLDVLTPRQRQIAALAVTGRHNKLIAHELGIAASTVRVLLARAARRLGARGRRELLALLDKHRSELEPVPRG